MRIDANPGGGGREATAGPEPCRGRRSRWSRATIPALVLGFILAALVALVALSTAFVLDARSPLTIGQGTTHSLSLSPPTDERAFQVVQSAAEHSGVVVLKWAPELSAAESDILVDVADRWSGPAEITRLIGPKATVVGSENLEHILFDGDFIVVGADSSVEQWRQTVAESGIRVETPLGSTLHVVGWEVFLYAPMVVLLASVAALVALAIPVVWAGLNTQALALLVLNGAGVLQRLRFIASSVVVPVVAASATVLGIVLVSLAALGRAQLLGPVVLVLGGYFVVVGVLLTLSLGVVLLLSPTTARVLSQRKDVIRGQLRLLSIAGLVTIGILVVSVVPFTAVVERGDEARVKAQALEALPESAVSLGLFGLPGDPVGPDPVHDAFLAAPLRELNEAGAVSLANVWLRDFGLDRGTALIVADQAYLDFVGEDGLHGPLPSEHPYSRQWVVASTYLGRSEAAQEVIANQSKIYEVVEGAVFAAPRSHLFEYAPAGTVVAVLPNVYLLTDDSLVSYGSNGSLLIDDIDLAEAAIYEHRTTNHWYPYLLSDGGEAAREYRNFNHAAALSGAATAAMGLVGIVAMMVWLRVRIRREELKLLLLDGRSVLRLAGESCARDLAALGILAVVAGLGVLIIHPAALLTLLTICAGLAVAVGASWLIMLAVLRHRIGAR